VKTKISSVCPEWTVEMGRASETRESWKHSVPALSPPVKDGVSMKPADGLLEVFVKIVRQIAPIRCQQLMVLDH